VGGQVGWWGQALGLEIASRIDLAPETGLSLDLGMRGADWLVRQRMSGYFPLRAAEPHIASGALALVDDAPRFDFPAYVCWRRSYDGETCEEILKIIRGSFEDILANGCARPSSRASSLARTGRSTMTCQQ